MPILVAAPIAVVGGAFWSFGSLGKRIGVEGSPADCKNIRATCTIFIYALTTLISPAVNILRTDPALLRATLGDPDWQALLPGIIAAGAVSGVGSFLGTLAFAYSPSKGSALVAIVENGVCTVSGAALIAAHYGECPPSAHYLAATLITVGILLLQKAPISDAPKTQGIQTSLGPKQMTSELPPQRLQRKAMLLAVMAGLCWGVGPLGKKYGVEGAAVGRKHVQTASSYMVYMVATNVIPVLQLVRADPILRSKTLGDAHFRRLMRGTMVCGLLSGLGGLLSTYAFTFTYDDNCGAVVSMIENGVYTVAGSLLIALVYNEHPSGRQLYCGLLVLFGILVSTLG
ncbi:unnamed protein product [Polarella glacialis]|uniref:EamA domain-containing protein n=1 Tax=Polarella glacialis TaxID=89957 RepID=A0A813LES0_POLGL|nr:unnamed protein product [Polarella glacialis]CAE8725201.1 unnamed protein product [Polarella glacialis]|mmetsp:Transcript_6038/g.9665  ORF Transcript_6038/g.9665 Transcript_6038/m.9665 type:complete len:343 (-) Transcript_6038:191-1219(-)|eukprot:CAMPEP_0115061806 /NCGR_PEP_ID=MMETSP0227-20121206/8203_1 /TAXON_ID=89957 /ORGANISM="Polarella glacialis, Strain CCMP 1383" /LENGTH=342 /DNA_ID=CAMNT_0002447131 /DNA_START=78 /DNA_END=1106 /DNA_ORIENTATION=-